MKKKARGRKQGRRSPSIDPRDVIRRQVDAFLAKYGRMPRPDEPLFFDPSKDEPAPMEADALRKEILDAMKIAGTPPEMVYGYTKTGLLLSSTFMETYPPDIVAEWNAALEEYFMLETKREHSDARPSLANDENSKISPSSLPGLKDLSFSNAEKRLVLECLEAVDGIISQSTSLRMKLELAAAILVYACSAAYDSAAAHGRADDASKRYDALEELAIARARELFNSRGP